MEEPRAMLKKADVLLGAGDAKGAVDLYVRVAQFYGEQGFALKAIAIWKQIRTIAARELRDKALDANVRAQLITMYRSLGLEADAHALEAEP
jgi:pilus assembly protein FimV